MTSKYRESVSILLQQLHGHGYFRPEAGPLKNRLLAAVRDASEGAVTEQISGRILDLEVSIGRHEGDEEVTLDLKVLNPGIVLRTDLPLASLVDPELEDLDGYLTHLVHSAAPVQQEEPGRTPGVVPPDSHDQAAAAARLKVTPQWLKSVVPCTNYTYEEIEGKKYLREYYWSKELIEKLVRIKSTKTTPEDLQYVAGECCEGDQDWARELIGRLKSPHRPEPAPKEQAQKNEAKVVTKTAVPGERGERVERTRSRSRHRRGKDRKPETAAGPKPPANQ